MRTQSSEMKQVWKYGIVFIFLLSVHLGLHAQSRPACCEEVPPDLPPKFAILRHGIIGTYAKAVPDSVYRFWSSLSDCQVEVYKDASGYYTYVVGNFYTNASSNPFEEYWMSSTGKFLQMLRFTEGNKYNLNVWNYTVRDLGVRIR